MKTTKKFDCVKMKDEAQQRRAERLRVLSLAQRLAYYRREHEVLRQRQELLRKGIAEKP